MIYDEYRGKDFVDLGETITIPMNIISQNNVLIILRSLGIRIGRKLILKSFLVLEQSKITIMILV